MQPPSEAEIRAASLRRGKLYVRTRADLLAFEDFKRVVELGTAAVLDDEQARLAIEALVAEGRVPERLLQTLSAAC